MANMQRHREYALAVLDLMESNPSIDVIDVDVFNAICQSAGAESVGARYGLAVRHSVTSRYIREFVRPMEIPFKEIFMGQLIQTVRMIGTHQFIAGVLEKDNPESELIAYSKNKLDKSYVKMEEWTGKVPVVKKDSVKHSLEAVSAMREFRELVSTVKLSIREFDEAKIRYSCTDKDGQVNYGSMASQLRHNHTDYDVLRLSRKIRRNTYWKLTAQPAMRIVVCENLLLLVEDPEFRLHLMNAISETNAEFMKRLTTASKAPNFTDAIDGMFAYTAKKKVFRKAKRDFMLSLTTI